MHWGMLRVGTARAMGCVMVTMLTGDVSTGLALAPATRCSPSETECGTVCARDSATQKCVLPADGTSLDIACGCRERFSPRSRSIDSINATVSVDALVRELDLSVMVMEHRPNLFYRQTYPPMCGLATCREWAVRQPADGNDTLSAVPVTAGYSDHLTAVTAMYALIQPGGGVDIERLESDEVKIPQKDPRLGLKSGPFLRFRKVCSDAKFNLTQKSGISPQLFHSFKNPPENTQLSTLFGG